MSRFNPYLAGLGNMDVASLVAVVYHAPLGAAETRELEWKTTWDLTPRFHRADLSRHIIGFANRDPDQAARVFGGHAFLLIGVAPGELGSPPELDPADITQMLSPYVGTQVSWHPVYVPFQGARILVLVVDPPRWGDPVWRLQRGSEDPDSGRVLKANTVFVRRPGTTVPADDEDLRRLAARAEAPRPELTVALDWNLGRSGNYIGVAVRNGTTAQPALLRQVGFTVGGACELTDRDPSGNEVKITAFAEFPIVDNPGEISPGQELTFRLGLDKSIPSLWDENTGLAPYVYFDDGHWLSAEPQKLIELLQFHGWSNNPAADPMLTSIALHCIDPPEFKDQVIRSDLTQADPTRIVLPSNEPDVYEQLGLADWPDVLDREAAVECIAAFAHVVGHMDDVAITITSDFENAVKTHLEPERAAVRTQDRGPYGKCMAKTMIKDDGSQIVIFDVHLFLKGMPSPEPTFRHEALHVLMHRRGESLNESRTTIADHHGLHPDLVAMAGIAAEEYRVERTLKPSWDELRLAFEHLCTTSHNAIHEAAIAYFYNHDTQAIRDSVMQAFSPMTVQAASVAACVDSGDLPTPTLRDAALHDRMLGASWNNVIDALRRLPPADVETSRDELELMVIEIARRFDEWLAQIGFRSEVLDDGSHYFHVYEHEAWCKRAPADTVGAA